MMRNVIKEITPLSAEDCFTIFSRVKKKFDYPLHYHDEYELNLILNARGAKRVVGDNMEIVDDAELVFIGPNLYHVWFTHQCTTEAIIQVTIQFHKDLFDEKFLQKDQLTLLKTMFDNARRGILFSRETTSEMVDRILNLDKKNGFDSVLALLSLLHDLSVSRNMKLLSGYGHPAETPSYNNVKIEKIFSYMNSNYYKEITLAEVARIANMSEAHCSRFIKKRTGKTFIDKLNEIRLGHASRMLINTTESIAEIAYKCGFNNISHFNRIFKRKKFCIPKDFRKSHTFVNSVFV